MIAAVIEDGRFILAEIPKQTSHKSALEQIGWQLENEGAGDQQVTINVFE